MLLEINKFDFWQSKECTFREHWLAQLVEHRTLMREVLGLNPRSEQGEHANFAMTSANG